jgi:hypothetical protein
MLDIPNTEERFDKIDSQLDKIATIIIKGFDDINKSLDTKASKEDIERVLGLLDALSKQKEISDDERMVMGHQLERLDKWTHALADKIGYKLSV